MEYLPLRAAGTVTAAVPVVNLCPAMTWGDGRECQFG